MVDLMPRSSATIRRPAPVLEATLEPVASNSLSLLTATTTVTVEELISGLAAESSIVLSINFRRIWCVYELDRMETRRDIMGSVLWHVLVG